MKQVFKDEVKWMPDPGGVAAGRMPWPCSPTGRKRNLPFRKIAATMNSPIIFDGRNCLHRDLMARRVFGITPSAVPRWKIHCV